MKGVISTLFLIGMLVLAAACGTPVNPEKRAALSVSEFSYMMIEKKCASGNVSLEPVTTEIAKSYNEFQREYPQAFFMIPPKFYDYKSPLIINIKEMELALSIWKAQLSTADLPQKLSGMAIDIFYLFQNIMRFEGQKCNFPALSTKKHQDLAPFMELRDFCNGKNGSNICSEETIKNLTSDESLFVDERILKICKSFNLRGVDCQAQYLIRKQNQQSVEMVNHYLKRFQKERFEKLFALKESHLKFQCQKIEEAVVMTLKVLRIGWDAKRLEQLLRSVAQTWSRKNFKINFEWVSEKGSDVIEIVMMKSGISHVADNNPRIVYLSGSLPEAEQQAVLAHEFGHVLGFPDCYTEFFDNQKKNLVYYEISKEDTNIMCTLKMGAKVPDDYLNQLTQNSCLFR